MFLPSQLYNFGLKSTVETIFYINTPIQMHIAWIHKYVQTKKKAGAYNNFLLFYPILLNKTTSHYPLINLILLLPSGFQLTFQKFWITNYELK